MNKKTLPPLTYIVQTRFCELSQENLKTEFNDHNILVSRKKAFEFINNYLEIITNDGLIKIDSNTINKKAINKINFDISEPKKDNYNFLKLLNQENIVIIPNKNVFPLGITLSFKINTSYSENIEHEIFSLEEIDTNKYTKQLNNLIKEYSILNELNYNLENIKVLIKKQSYEALNLKNESSYILDTPFNWQHYARQIFLNKVFDEEFHFRNLYEHLINHKKYNYVSFLEENCTQEIEENIYSMLHDKGGILFVGYHPDNFIESVLSDQEIKNYYKILHTNFSKDRFLYKNINLEIIDYDDFLVLCIIVYPLNEESKLSNAYNPDKIFIRQNNKIIKIIK
ncbi:hypothetical protein [Chishuiella sp.]|uniref:hypothetical protein n=1 Tax=Chishuiella sp. TaxID=1969467 RepID=UPI0028ADADE7|nr:hypothetical protein [Chishuiella sp.]